MSPTLAPLRVDATSKLYTLAMMRARATTGGLTSGVRWVPAPLLDGVVNGSYLFCHAIGLLDISGVSLFVCAVGRGAYPWCSLNYPRH